MRFKYHPDGTVLINSSYAVSFQKFSQHCLALNISNPLTEGDFFEYVPGKGAEIVTREGHHVPVDNMPDSLFQGIIDRVDDFIEEGRPSPTPSPTRVERIKAEKLTAWPLEKRVDALIAAQAGDIGKVNQLRADFVRIESEIK